jgi:hypothetical protein
MPVTDKLNVAQRAAFRAAKYYFSSPDGQVLVKVDEPNTALADLLRSCNPAGAAVITAFNPHGRRQDDALNRTAQNQLLSDLRTAGHTLLPGRNEDPAGVWPIEESFLVLGIGLPAARMLAARYGQLAFLWADAANATPRLMETAASA